jgi:hypothetical protein
MNRTETLLLVLILTITPILGTARNTHVLSPSIQVCLVLDGSGSITLNEWQTILDAVADGVTHAVPRDGSVEVTIVQFGYPLDDGYAKTEVYPTEVTTSSYSSLTSHIRAIDRSGSGTSTPHGIYLA